MHKLHRSVPHEIGLAVLMGAFVAAWFGAGYSSLKATLAAPIEYETMLIINQMDSDFDGVPDQYDAHPFTK